LLAAQQAFAAGKDDIAISPSGCTRLLIDRSDAGVITSELMFSPPFKNDPTQDGFFFSSRIWAYASTGYTLTIDSDTDQFFETRGKVVYEQSAVFEQHAPSNDVVIARKTVKVSSDGRSLEVKEEDASSGTLGVKASYSSALVQRTCRPSEDKPAPIDFTTKQPATLNTRACLETELTTARDAMNEGVIKGARCLNGAGLDAKSTEVLHNFVRNDFKVECASDLGTGVVSVNDRGYHNLFPGKARLVFQDVFFNKGSGNDAEHAGTAFHELMHFTEIHDPDLESAALDSDMRLIDQVYGCEYACFGDLATVCHLAACMGKTVSTKGNMTSCKGTLDDAAISRFNESRARPLGSCTTGKQVGALCKNEKTTGKNVFCTTEMECNSACAGPCESKSISCDPACR